MAILWTFKLLLHFDELLFSNLLSEDKLCTDHKYNYFSENALFSKNVKLVTEIYLKSLGTKKKHKKVKLAV